MNLLIRCFSVSSAVIVSLGVGLASAQPPSAFKDLGPRGEELAASFRSFRPHLARDSSYPLGPREVVEAVVKANEDCDVRAMMYHIADDPDQISYTIMGIKYKGVDELKEAMEQECRDVAKLEIPLRELNVWERGDVAWFQMEIDYIRVLRSGNSIRRVLYPLRETGVLERRHGRWLIVNFHEAFRNPSASAETEKGGSASPELAVTAPRPDLSGTWDIHEEDRSYVATLDAQGEGTYDYMEGSIHTMDFSNGLWTGTWAQKGNDREGGFEVRLSADGREASGQWWYTRVDKRKNIPPKQYGGKYTWKKRN